MSAKNKKDEHGLEDERIRALAAILEETGLTEIEIETDDVRLRVSRQGGVVAAAPPAAVMPAAPASPPETALGENHPGAVQCPMVGTAYLSPSPGADPFVREGAPVSEGQTILIVEAMKTMNPIAAPRSGTVTKIMVNDAQPVEYGEPLLIIE